MGIIDIKGLTKAFKIDTNKKEVVLKGLELSIEKATVTAIYGPSGCGKSTLLNIVSGLDRDYEGDVYVESQSLKIMNENQITNFRKTKIGFVFQNFNLIPHLSVMENVMMPMHLNGEKSSDNKRAAYELLKEVQLEEYKDKNVTKLSGGQKQRVAIARALANSPEIIIADEPTGSLDSSSSEKILKILKNLAKKGKTIIIVTHSDEVAKYATNVVEMLDGVIINKREQVAQIKSDEPLQTEKRHSFKKKESLRISFSNFMERKFRNIMIALATAIGLSGVLISLGLGSGILGVIEEETGGGRLPSQIQVTLNREMVATGVLNKEDEIFLENLIGSENTKYLEAPFSVMMEQITIGDKGTLNFEESFSAYTQIVSLFSDTSILVAANNESEVVEGELYHDADEIGLTITTTFVEDFNKNNNSNLEYEDFIGLPVMINLVEATSEGNNQGQFETTIIRIIDDSVSEGNSHMSKGELEKVIEKNNFTKSVPYIIFDLKNPEDNSQIITTINDSNKYIALSQQSMLSMIINFIRIIQGLLIFMSLQAVIVSTVMIGIILYINIVERTREIGIMRAVGYQVKNIKSIFSYEALIITLISYGVSILASAGIGALGNYIVSSRFENIPRIFRLDIKSIGLVLILSILIGAISSVFPVRKISKVDPADALRYE